MSEEEAYRIATMSEEELIDHVSIYDPIVFAEANLKDEQGDALDYTWQHAFHQQYIKDFSPEICVKKSSQVGITTASVTKVIYLTNIRGAKNWNRVFGRKGKSGIKVIYTFPTEKDVSDFSSTRFRPMVSSSPQLVKNMGGKAGVNSVLRKEIGNSLVLFRGTHQESQAISAPADLIVTDELDFSDQTVVDAFDSRLSHSDLKWWWKFSTPTIPNFGIDAEFKKSSQYHWIVRCEWCNKDQRVLFPHSIRRKKVSGVSIEYWGCRKCGKELNRANGLWIPRYPNRDYKGYYIPPTICPWIQPKDIKSSRKRYRTDKGFYNFALGMAYSTGEDVITRQLMLQRIEYGDPYNSITDRMTYMGVDQGNILHYVIARGKYGRREILEVGNFKSFDDIGSKMHEYNIALCVMDGQPNTHSAMNLAKAFPGRILLSTYKEFDEDEVMKEAPKKKYGIMLDRTGILDLAADSWRRGESWIVLNKHQYSRIPDFIDDPETDDGFIQQLGNMTRDEEENAKTQKVKSIWKRTGPDHYRHADAYCLAAWMQHQGASIDQLIVRQNPMLIASSAGDMLEIAGTRSTLWTPH